MRRCLTLVIVTFLLGACDGPGSGDMVRSAPQEVSAGDSGTSSPPSPGTPPEGSTGAVPGDAAADDRERVVFLGTSLTEGYGLPDTGLAFPGVIQGLIDREGLPFRVVNAGVAGDTSAGGLARLTWVLNRPARVLVVELGANDGLRGLPVQALEDNLRSVVRRARELHPEIAVVLVAMEAPPNLGPDYVDGFRSSFVDVAREEGAHLVPFLLDGIAGIPDLNQDDGIHPTAEGHERMAQRVWDVLEPLLSGTTAAASSGGPS